MKIDRRQALSISAGSLAACLLAKPLFGAEAELTLESLEGKRILFFTKSAGFEHSVIKSVDGAPSYADRMMRAFAEKYGFTVTSSKDGRIFDDGYQDFDCYLFYTTGDLTDPNVKNAAAEPPMSKRGKQNLLDAIAGGKGFAGSHCASDTFHSAGHSGPGQWKNQTELDPYIAMIGGEFAGHGKQQKATVEVVDPTFPGTSELSHNFVLHEEWYSLKNLAEDMHVILLQHTEGMDDRDYQRPAYPSTWARKHGDGRVFYTSMGHREDVWTNPIFESVLLGGLAWASGALDAKIPSNLKEAAPEAASLPTS